jgi:hypothetical protein
MQLINQKTGFVVVEFQDDEVIIHDRFLKAALENEGITIPEDLQSEYDNKDRVFVNDRTFQKAFINVFYQQAINHSTYKWEEDGQ